MHDFTRILIADDSPDDAELLLRHLRASQLRVEHIRVDSAADFSKALESEWDAILCDYSMPSFDAPQALDILRNKNKDIPCILVSGSIGEERAVEMMRLGARDIIMKERLARLAPALEREISEAKVRAQKLAVERSLAEANVKLNRLRRFFPPQIADSVVSGEIDDPFKWHRSDVTVLFIDLRGFTQFAENGEPDHVMAALQSYYAEVAQVAHTFGGSIGHIAADGIMMFFNDPVPLARPRDAAVGAAINIRKTLGALCREQNTHFAEAGLNFGMGIADGTATIGGIGEEGCWDYTVVGTVANLASRLCGKATDGQILISHRFLCRLNDRLHTEDIGETPIKGLKQQVKVFNILSALQ